MLLVNISHGLLAMYLLTLLAVPKVQTPLVTILCLLCLFAGQWRQPPAVGQRLRAGGDVAAHERTGFGGGGGAVGLGLSRQAQGSQHQAGQGCAQ